MLVESHHSLHTLGMFTFLHSYPIEHIRFYSLVWLSDHVTSCLLIETPSAHSAAPCAHFCPVLCSQDGGTALGWAAGVGIVKDMTALIEAGCNLEAKNKVRQPSPPRATLIVD